MAKATAHHCKRDMAWSEDAGRGRTKAWMQASGRRQRSWTASGAMAKATAHRGSVTWHGCRDTAGADEGPGEVDDQLERNNPARHRCSALPTIAECDFR